MPKKSITPPSLIGQLPDVSPENKQLALDSVLEAADPRRKKFSIVKSRGDKRDAEKEAMFALRKYARKNHCIVASPTELLKIIPGRYTYGDEESRKVYRLDAATFVSPDGEQLKQDRTLAQHGAILIRMADEYDLGGHPPALPDQADEIARWEVRSPLGRHIGYVVRTQAEGKPKHDRLHLRRLVGEKHEWVLPSAPPCDLRPFYDASRTGFVAMAVVEGPMTLRAAEKLQRLGRYLPLANTLVLAWHGAKHGAYETDWSMCAGRVVRLYSDGDEAGFENMLAVASCINDVGGIPIVLRFSKPIGPYDFADKEYLDALRGGTYKDLAKRRDPARWENHTRPFTVEEEPEAEEGEEDEMPEAVQSKRRHLNPAFLKSWVWSPSSKSFLSNVCSQEFDKAEFTQRHGKAVAKMMASPWLLRALDTEVMPGVPFGLQPDGTFNRCLEDPRRRLGPADTANFPVWFNTYMEHSVPDVVARDAVLDFFAQAVAYPGTLPGWGLLITGPQDQGKSTFCDWMCNLIGNTVLSTIDGVFGTYTPLELVDALFVRIEELYDESSGKGKGNTIYQQSKSLITSPTRLVNPKGKPAFSIKNITRLVLTSNQDNALLMEEDDRRWLVVRFGGKMPGFSEAKLLGGNTDIFRALWRRGLERPLPTRAPRTEARAEMLDATIPRNARMAIDFCLSLSVGDCVLWSDLQNEFALNGGFAKKHMRRAMMSPVGQVSFPRANGKQIKQSVWMRGNEAAAKKLAADPLKVIGLLRDTGGSERASPLLKAIRSIKLALDNPPATPQEVADGALPQGLKRRAP